MELYKAKISWYKIKKIIEYFSLDLTATQASKISGINRNTVNRYYRIFREVIYKHQEEEFKKFI